MLCVDGVCACPREEPCNRWRRAGYEERRDKRGRKKREGRERTRQQRKRSSEDEGAQPDGRGAEAETDPKTTDAKAKKKRGGKGKEKENSETQTPRLVFPAAPAALHGGATDTTSRASEPPASGKEWAKKEGEREREKRD